MVLGNRAHLSGLNIVGMRRRGVSRDEIHDLRTAYRLLFAPEGAFAERLTEVASQFADHPRVMEMVDFIRSADGRAICMPLDPGRMSEEARRLAVLAGSGPLPGEVIDAARGKPAARSSCWPSRARPIRSWSRA